MLNLVKEFWFLYPVIGLVLAHFLIKNELLEGLRWRHRRLRQKLFDILIITLFWPILIFQYIFEL